MMMPGDDVLTMPAARRIEVFTGTGRRRRWSAEAKAAIVAESYVSSVGEVAERHGLAKTQLFTWRRDAQQATECSFARVEVDDKASSREPAGGEAIEVRVGAATVRIPLGADPGLVTAILMALRSSR
jgi:transposase